MGNNLCGCNKDESAQKLETNALANVPEESHNDMDPQIKNSSTFMNVNEDEDGKNLLANLAERYNNLSRIEQISVLNKQRNAVRSVKNYSSNLSGQQSSPFDYQGGRDADGKKQGFGVQKWQDGSKFIGFFDKNKATGWGIFDHADGDIYRGEFSNDRTNGYGEYEHENGAKYYGYWTDDTQYGEGYEVWSDSSKYTGEYSNGKKNGIGTYLWQDKTMYEGEWKENNIHGYGIYHFVDGRVYTGQWKSNQMHGYGEFVWQEGKKYCGFYKCDKKDGFGIYYWPTEKFFLGFWREGKQNGVGKYIKGDTVKYGLWRDGKKEKWFANEGEFQNCLDPRDEKYLNIFQWGVPEIKSFMELN